MITALPHTSLWQRHDKLKVCRTSVETLIVLLGLQDARNCESISHCKNPTSQDLLTTETRGAYGTSNNELVQSEFE